MITFSQVNGYQNIGEEGAAIFSVEVTGVLKIQEVYFAVTSSRNYQITI
jgi:hypothetical protein